MNVLGALVYKMIQESEQPRECWAADGFEGCCFTME
jgi:hypothetical protein